MDIYARWIGRLRKILENFVAMEIKLRERRGSRFAAGVVIHPREQTIPLGDRLWALPIGALWS
jgi:hypothetical protein